MKENESHWKCMNVSRLMQRLSEAPQDAPVHVDLADDDGNVWKGDIDGLFVDDDGECWLQAGLVHHQTPEETLELTGDDEDEEDEEEDEHPETQ